VTVRSSQTTLLAIAAFAAVSAGQIRSDAPAAKPLSASGDSSKAAPDRPTVKEAQGRAVILHDLANELLRAVHQAYYREDAGLPIPAMLLREVFDESGKRSGVQFRWLAVDADAMNVDHKPKSEFETAAVQALIAGDSAHEETREGVYRRVGVVPLTSECLKCHLPNRRSAAARRAALMISMPIQTEK
jgi:hypothetical protein